MKRHQEYADGLIRTHGQEKAVKIVTECLQISQREFGLTFFDEAEFFVNDHGRYEFAKVQSNKVVGKKQKRIKANQNFYALVLQLLNKGQKNVSKN